MRSAGILTLILTLAATAAGSTAVAATLLTDKSVQVVILRNVTSNDNQVSGELVNSGKQPVRDVQLQILYSWRWKNEFHPGNDDPGQGFYYSVDKEIAPGQSVPFTFKPIPALPTRSDGQYEITASVAGYSQIFMGSR
jgi:hypothetical protein